MADEVDFIRTSVTSKMLPSSPVKAPQPDLVNCAERSILAKLQQQQQADNNCKGIFGDAVVCNKSGTFKTSPLEKFNMFVEGQGGKLRKRSEPLKAVIRPKFVKSASIARLLGNNYSTATTNLMKYSPTSGAQAENVKVAVEPRNQSVGAKKPDKFQKCGKGQEVINEENKETKKEAEEDKDAYDNRHKDSDRKVSFSSHESCPTAECAEELSIRGSHLNLMSHNSDIRTLRALRTLTKGLGKLLRRRTDSVEISPPDPEFKVSYLGNVLTGWAKGDGCFEKPLATLWRNYTQVQKPDVLMRIKVCPSGLKATTKQHGLTEYWSHRITYCSAPKNYPRVFCWIYRHEGRKMKHELRCHAVLCSKDVTAKDICSQLQGNLFRALKEFKRDKISKQNARLSLANCVYDNPSLPRRKLMLSVGGNNYRPPLERSKSAPKLMVIEEVEDDDEEREEEQYRKSSKRYSQVGSVGRKSWLQHRSISVVENAELGEDAQRERGHGKCLGEAEEDGHEIDEIVQESSFKLTPSVSRSEDEEAEHDCDNETDGLEGEIMSYFEKKLSERAAPLDEFKGRNKSMDCALDTDDIISHLIRNQPHSSRASVASLTSPAASEPDEPESLRYQIEDLDSDADSDQPRLSPSLEGDDLRGIHRNYPGKGIQMFQMDDISEMSLVKKGCQQHTDSDSDVSDESGFIEYQDHKYPINADINKADNSILV